MKRARKVKAMKQIGIVLLLLIMFVILGRSIAFIPEKIEEMGVSYRTCRQAESGLKCAYYVARGERFKELIGIACGSGKSTTFIIIKSDKRELVYRIWSKRVFLGKKKPPSNRFAPCFRVSKDSPDRPIDLDHARHNHSDLLRRRRVGFDKL